MAGLYDSGNSGSSPENNGGLYGDGDVTETLISESLRLAQEAAAAAATSETNAGTSETNAKTSETNAKNSEDAAAQSETNAGTSETNAFNSAQAAAQSFDDFDDIYLGAYAVDPTLDNDGDPLQVGALYFNTVTDEMKAYSGTAWVVAYVSGAAGEVTYENLDANGDVGTGAGQVAQGDHNHSGVYEPAFTKNGAFNKDFGDTAGTVAVGDHDHGTQYEPKILVYGDAYNQNYAVSGGDNGVAFDTARSDHSHALATDTIKGMVEKSTTLENQAGNATDVWPDVAGVKEMIDAFGVGAILNAEDWTATKGYAKFEDGGLTIQWGSKAVAASSSPAETFAVTFTTLFTINTQVKNSIDNSHAQTVGVQSASTTGFTIDNADSGYQQDVFWVAIGRIV